MAFPLLSSFRVCSVPRQQAQWKSISNNSSSSSPTMKFFCASQNQSEATTRISTQDHIVRRSANYRPSIWDNDFFQSLRSDYLQSESYTERANKLIGEVRMMFDNVVDPLQKLDLIDNLQRLGLSYHFKHEINKTLNKISTHQIGVAWKKNNLYATALEFRLLRQHGYHVNQDVFTSFMDEIGKIKASFSQDCLGMLNLYEASYLSVEGETILKNARDSAAKHLKECLKQNNDDYFSMLADHALELPLHWRMQRLEARWYLDVYKMKEDKNPIILELAVLNFNIIQALHQEDLKYASKWWKDLGLAERLSFARDRLMDSFLWSVGTIIDPRSGKSRIIQTKVISLLTVIDDVYDVYGTLDELELFTEAVERWDINAIERLPNYMKICFHALFNTINEIAFDTLKEQEIDVTPFLRKLWTNILKAYLLEAKWYYSGYKPTLQEYIDNAWISIGGSIMLGHAYLVTDPITKEGLQSFEEYGPNIIRWSSLIVRLVDDLATSSDELKRGDVSKSIQCHMNDSGASEEEACEHIRKLIDATWKKINESQISKSCFSEKFIEVCMNLARLSQCLYQYGDGHGIEDGETKDRVFSLIVHPIPAPK
ncbi:hypothetical protein PTKIN_Ptkin19aG0094000 [Pterospermum kingtungense]